jgi:flagellar export protein FliJ
MSFQSPFDFLLRTYRAHEDREEITLHLLNRQLTRAISQFEECTASRQQMHNELRGALGEGVFGAGLHFERACDNALIERRAVLEASIRQLTMKVEAQRKVLLEVRRRREVVESLRNQQYEVWELDQKRREQKSADELFLMRQGKGRA